MLSPPIGWWRGNSLTITTDALAIRRAIAAVDQPVSIVRTDEGDALAPAGQVVLGGDNLDVEEGLPVIAWAPPCRPSSLGDASFRSDFGLRFAYVTGAMANGIASAAIVEAMCHAGMLGFFGAAGLSPAVVEQNIDRLRASLSDKPWGANLIHSPNEPTLEAAIVDLYLRKGVRLVEASAYLDLTLPVVLYRVHGIHRDGEGNVVAPNRIIAKVSRIEVARKFFAPPPPKLLAELVSRGDITSQQAELARHIPMAQDLTAEAHSGGHTDNRPAIALIPAMLALRDQMQAEYGYAMPLRVGAAGGIATPASAAASFAMGASYIVTGSINQACIESGSSDAVRQMLAEAEQADTIMAPAADMFEMGVKVQVLRRGTMFAMRGAKLFELYRNHNSIEEIPATERATLEKQYFRATLDEIWAQCEQFFRGRDPSQLQKAARDAKHRMALIFRWYLGMSSRWANAGEPSRKLDYQVWCGPAMGAFNQWTRGTLLEKPANRRVALVARNILYGTAVLIRAASLRQQGAHLPTSTSQFVPLDDAALLEHMA